MKNSNAKLMPTLVKLTVMTSLVFLPVVALASGGGGHADSGVILKDFAYRCSTSPCWLACSPIL